MKSKAYKLIFVLLSSCVLFILIVQGFWIRNFYLQKKEEFNRTVYASLEELDEKLRNRRNLETIKMTYFIQNGDTLSRTPSRSMHLSSQENVQVLNKSAAVKTKEIISLSKNISGKDSFLVNGNNQDINVILNGNTTKVSVFEQQLSAEKMAKDAEKILKESKEISTLINKMLTEIKVIDTEVENVDTLNLLIQRTLENKGLFLPFEFSLQKIEKKSRKILAQSEKFSEHEPSYKSDLSAQNVISNHNYLLLQFPKQQDFVMAGMKGSVILSLIFSLVIMAVFYSVARLILKQKKLGEIKNDFINNITHELKTPIATISLALDGITNPLVKNDEDKFNEYTRVLKEENSKLNQHVEKVLQIALLDKGELSLHKEPLNLVQVIHTAISNYKLQIEELKAEIYFKPGTEEVLFSGDRQHLETVFGNLIDNALKYSGNQCKIIIDLKKTNAEIIILFKDNGIGIDPTHQKHIFDKFYRAQGGNLHDVKGFGLGLSYVKSIIEAHKGIIEVQSEKGKGSEFIIKLESR